MKRVRRALLLAAPVAASSILVGRFGLAIPATQRTSEDTEHHHMPSNTPQTAGLSDDQKAIIPIAAFAASGDIPQLSAALENGLNAGLSISAVKELLVQVYAYAGFPRSLNALGEFMKVLHSRKERGITDKKGPEPSQVSMRGTSPLEAGTRNQTSLVGAPVKGPLFDFAPAIDEFLKTHPRHPQVI